MVDIAAQLATLPAKTCVTLLVAGAAVAGVIATEAEYQEKLSLPDTDTTEAMVYLIDAAVNGIAAGVFRCPISAVQGLGIVKERPPAGGLAQGKARRNSR